MAQKAEIKVDKAAVYDKKLEADVKKTAKAKAEAAASETFEESYVIKLVPTLKLDEKARELVATCGWQIFEGGGTKLFAPAEADQAVDGAGDGQARQDHPGQPQRHRRRGRGDRGEGDHEVAEGDEMNLQIT